MTRPSASYRGSTLFLERMSAVPECVGVVSVSQIDVTLPYVVCCPSKDTLLRLGDAVFVLSPHPPKGSYEQRFCDVGLRRLSSQGVLF